MKQIASAFRRTKYGAAAALFLLAAVAVALPARQASAAGLLYRSLTLTSTQPSGLSLAGAGGVAADPGEAANGDKVGHTYVFQAPTAGNLGGLKIQYCTGPFDYLDFDDGSGACTGPTGLSSTAATAVTIETFTNLGNFNSNTVAATDTGYARDASSTANELILTKASSPLSVAAGGFVRVTLTATGSVYFVNPSGTPATFFAHLETYATSGAATGADNSNPPVDEGTVTSSTANTITINTRVQETLKFSVEGEETPTSPAVSVAEGATCDALTGSGAINMGDPLNSNALSASQAYDGYSYFRLATNSSKGAKVLYAGETLRSTAGDSITALTTTPAPSAKGTEQFGLAISTDNTINDIQTTEVANDLTVASPYDGGLEGFTTNDANGDYAFDTTSNGAPKLLVSSTDVVGCDTGTVRYIANISNNTPAGLYSTKISYIAVPSY